MSGAFFDAWKNWDRLKRLRVDSQRPPLREFRDAPPNLQWVKLDSLTQTDGRYDGQIYFWDGAAGAFDPTGKGDVWVEFANGITPETTKYYHAQEVDFENGRAVFLVDDISAGSFNLTVQDDDGTPSYSNISTIQVDQDDGFAISQPGAGVVKLDFNFIVEEVDGSPSVTPVHTIRFDQADGFAVTNPSTGVARIDLTSAGFNLTVEDIDSAPQYTSVHTIRFDQADGFVLSNPSAGIARIDFNFKVEENDGTPSYSPIHTIRLHQDDGLFISQPATGIVLVEIAHASVTQAGIVSLIAQEFEGEKTFDDRSTHQQGMNVTNTLHTITAGSGTLTLGVDQVSNPSSTFNVSDDVDGTGPGVYTSSDSGNTCPYSIVDSAGTHVGGTGTVRVKNSSGAADLLVDIRGGI